MKKQTFSVCVCVCVCVIKPTQVLKTGEATIQMRITLCGQRWEMYLKARVAPNLWNQKRERATGKNGQCFEINMYLDSIRARIYEIQREVEDEGTPLTLDVIKAKLTGAESKAGKCKMFFSVFQEEIDRMESLIGIDYVKITISRYKLCLNSFKELSF